MKSNFLYLFYSLLLITGILEGMNEPSVKHIEPKVSQIEPKVSQSTQKNRMLSDLNFIKKIFEESYAPAEWKRERFAWDLEGQFQSVVDEINNNQGKDIKQFQKSLRKFCQSTRDYHVSISFTSTEYASLPFDIRCRNGKYILTNVNEDAEVEEDEALTLKNGDEILSMNGIPIKTVVTELEQEIGEENKPSTDRAMALEVLTKRNGRLGHTVPQGSCSIEVKKNHSGKIETYLVSWNYKAERISNPFTNRSQEEIIKEGPMKPFLENQFNQRKSTLPYYEEMTEVFTDDGLPKDQLGSRKNMFSTIGTQNMDQLEDVTAEEQISWLWNWFWKDKLSEEAKRFFDAKLIELPSGKLAGYVRIATFVEKEEEEALKAFISCIKYFQNHADMLLIDQMNNPGGSPYYMYELASVLIDHPMIAMKERKRLTQNDVLQAIDLIDFSQTYERELLDVDQETQESFQNLVRLAHHYLSEWELGHLLTDPYPALGMEMINPHPNVNFTKPIFILVNELCFSCGDAFPGLFQDNKRATIIGTPTAGAGGSVVNSSFNNLNGIHNVTYTNSILYRLDGTPLENVGVTPDIIFDFNNELYDNDNISADFTKIYEILDSMTENNRENKN